MHEALKVLDLEVLDLEVFAPTMACSLNVLVWTVAAAPAETEAASAEASAKTEADFFLQL